MPTYQSFEELMQICEKEMRQLEADKSFCFDTYRFIRQTFDSCLPKQDYNGLLELLPIFEKTDLYPQFHHSGETYKLYTLLYILKLEIKYDKKPFLSFADTYEQLLAQYHQAVFSLRRLEFALSQSDMAQAVQYLHSVSFNIYVAKIMIENGYFENYNRLYWNLYFNLKDVWSVMDQIQWLIFLLEINASDRVLLEMASLYMELGDYVKSYQYLSQIASPNQETSTLISSLKELLCYE